MSTPLTTVAPLYGLLTSALTTPLGIPAMLALIDNWKLRTKTVWRIGAVLIAGLGLCYALIYLTLGNSSTAKALVAVGSPLVCWGMFIFFVRFRDGRLLFSIVTGLGLAVMTEALATILAPRDTPAWLLWKVGLTAVQFVPVWLVARKPFLQMLKVSDTGWVTMSLVPMGMIAAVSSGYIFPTVRHIGTPRALPSLIVMGVAVLFYVVLFYFLRDLQKHNRAAQDHALLHSQMRFLEQQVALVREGDRETRTFKHDLRHYTELLRATLEAGDKAAARTLLDGMEADAAARMAGATSLRAYTGNPIVDSVLSLAANEAEAAGVAFSVQVDWPERLPADVVQFGVVLSNLLENALNACRRIPPGEAREIKVSGNPGKAQFFLSVENTFAGAVRFDPDTGLPITDRKGHGYGTLSVAAFAKQYGAILDFSAKEGWFRFGMLL